MLVTITVEEVNGCFGGCKDLRINEFVSREKGLYNVQLFETGGKHCLFISLSGFVH